MCAAAANNKATSEEAKLSRDRSIATIGLARGHLTGGPPFVAGGIGRFRPAGAAWLRCPRAGASQTMAHVLL